MNKLKSEELNILSFDDYFDVMKITTEQKKARVRLAESFLDAFLFVFAYAKRNKDLAQVQARTKDEMTKAVPSQFKRDGIIFDSFIKDYLALTAASIAATTLKGSEYDTSYERAWYVAANEANSVMNYADLRDAIARGYTHKTWIAEIDERTRDEHLMMDGKTIPIEEYFLFSDCRMLMPHDAVNGSIKQIANCRCSLSYSVGNRKAKKEKDSEKPVEKRKNGAIIKPYIPDDKIDKWLLNPNTKHYIDFISVGYSAAYPERLAKDISLAFAYEKAVKSRETKFGESFAVETFLGVTEKKLFRTVWMIRNENPSEASFVTAYRIRGNSDV